MRISGTRRIGLLLAAWVVLGGAVTAGATSVPPSRWLVIAPHPDTWSFTPQGVAVDAARNVYVADSRRGHVLKFSPSGRRLGVFGAQGTGPGQFQPLGSLPSPYAIAADRSGTTYAADPGNGRVVVFSARGQYRGSLPLGSGTQAIASVGVAVDGKGHLFVGTAVNTGCPDVCRGTVTTTEFSGRRQIGRWTVLEAGSVDRIQLAAGADGTLYTAIHGAIDCYKSCPAYAAVVRRAPSGVTTTIVAANDLDLAPVSGMAVGPHGNVFVTDALHSTVRKLSPRGADLAVWQMRGSTPFQVPVAPSGLAVDARGDIVVGDAGSGLVRRLSDRGRIVARWGAPSTALGRFWFPGAVAVGRSGDLYVLDTGNSRVQQLSPRGSVLRVWGSGGHAPGQFALPVLRPLPGGIAVDAQENVYVADAGNNRVQKFSATGRLLAVWKTGLPSFDPEGVAVGRDGRVYVVGYGGVWKFSAYGRLLAHFPVPGPLPDRASDPHGIAVAPDGTMYLSDTANNHILKLSPGGALLTTWGVGTAVGSEWYRGSAPGEFWLPAGVAVDGHGRVWVGDTGNDRVQVLNASGTVEAVYRSGIVPGQFTAPNGLSYDGAGHMYVADTGNDRIQRCNDR